ncbi:MAG: hypothetical protein HYW23_03480 [Candidatus Aenigmarchaeota archaeon]|nr:hypothetical protein [Candidatus Aenigmarchaeota archaeon]
MKGFIFRPVQTGGFGRLAMEHALVICPACNTEIGINDVIEMKGYVGCVNCAR